jgi:HK97 gp10 family phage protein
MSASVKTTGFTEAQGKMRLLREAVRDQGVRDGVRAGGIVIRDAMRLQAPILDHRTAKSTALEPGAIKRDIRSRLRQTDRLGYAQAIIGPRLTAHVASWVEYGHQLIKRIKAVGARLHVAGGGQGRVIGTVDPQPFLRPAYEASIEKAKQAFAEVIEKEIKEVLQ